MLYALVDLETKEIKEYPIQTKAVQQRLKEMNISIPLDIDSADLRSLGYYKVPPDSDLNSMPIPPAGSRVILGVPQWGENDTLIRTWAVVPIDKDYSDRLWKRTRELRNELLKESDWTELPSVRAIRSAEWATAWDTYRQQLRDMTNVEHPTMVVFPGKPSNEIK